MPIINSNLRGWSSSGQLTQGNRVREISLQADFDEPGAYTVQFSMQQPAVIAGVPNFAAKAEAIIEWKVEGNWVTRVVSLGNGVSVSGVGQAVRVKMADRSPTLYLPPQSPQPYFCGAQVVRGTRAATQQPPVYTPVDEVYSVAPGASLVVPVPGDAGVISVQVTMQSAGLASSLVVDGDGLVQLEPIVALGPTIFKRYDPRNYTWIPVVGGNEQLRLINRRAAGTALLFGVSFGIDG